MNQHREKQDALDIIAMVGLFLVAVALGVFLGLLIGQGLDGLRWWVETWLKAK